MNLFFFSDCSLLIISSYIRVSNNFLFFYLFQDRFGHSVSQSMRPPGLLYNGTTELEDRQFRPNRVDSVGPLANYPTLDVCSHWSDTDTDSVEFRRHVQSCFLSDSEKMNPYGTRDLNAPYLYESDLSDGLSGLRLTNNTVIDERSYEEQLQDEMLKRRQDLSTKLRDDNQCHMDGNFLHTPRSGRMDIHSPLMYGDGILRRQVSALDGSNVSRLNFHRIKDVDHLPFAEELATTGSDNLHRDTNPVRNANMANMINPMSNRYNSTDFEFVRNRKAFLNDVLAQQYLQDRSLFYSVSGPAYKDGSIYHEDPRFPYLRMQRSRSHFQPNSRDIQSDRGRQSSRFFHRRTATGLNLGSQVYHDNSLLKHLDLPLDNVDKNGVDSLELINVVGHVKEVRQVLFLFAVNTFCFKFSSCYSFV